MLHNSFSSCILSIMTPIIPQDFNLPFLRREQTSKDAYSFFFDRTVKPDYTFLPGQYNKVFLPHENPDNRGTNRNFSAASSPLNTKELMITTRIVQSSFKKALFNLAPGTEVQFFGPVGRFVFDESETVPHVFLAGGIGITPFHSMLDYIAEKNITIPVTLFASFSTVEDFLYYEEFIAIANAHPTVKVVYTVTKPELSKKSWTGETGRVTPELIKKYIPNILDCITMTCGPIPMVDGTLEMLSGMGVQKENLRKENFVGY
jgi:ferredoxin-NADP reductase